MIYRQIKFDFIEQQPDKTWLREPVTAVHFIGGMGAYQVEVASRPDELIDLNWLNNGLLQSTGNFDKVGFEIYHGHILANDKGDLFEVVFYEGAFWFQSGEKGEAVSEPIAAQLTIVGDVYSNRNLLLPPNPDEIMKQSAERKILPPIFKLKKKQ